MEENTAIKQITQLIHSLSPEGKLEIMSRVASELKGSLYAKEEKPQQNDPIPSQPAADELLALKSLMAEIESNNEKIRELKSSNEQLTDQVIKRLWLATQDWEPAVNEKAVVVRPDDHVAWFVWFVGDQGRMRFKEAPIEVEGFNNYYSMEKDEEPVHAVFYIIPLSFFEELQKTISFTVYQEKHTTYPKSLWR